MRIAFIGGRDIRKLGGIENYMYNLASKLAEMGHEPIVYCESDHDGEEEINGFKVIHQKSLNSKFWTKPILGLKAILKTIRNEKDINIYHFNAGGPAYFAWIARIFGKTTIYQGHGIEWRRTKWKWYQRIIMMFTDACVVVICTKYAISVSQEQTKLINKLYHKKCTTIPTAVNIPCSDIGCAPLDSLGLKNNGYFLFLGRLVQDKNPDILIKAFIKADLANIKLVIAGSNDTDPQYVAYLKQLSCNNRNILFTGAVYGETKDALLAHCLAFCIPSTIEGLAITLLEAMSYGRICIASDIEANKEGLGDNGIWVKAEDIDTLANAIKNVYDNYDQLSHIGKANKKRIEQYYTWDKIVRKYISYIQSLN